MVVNTIVCNFLGNFFVGQVEDSRVGGWCSLVTGGRTSAWIILFLMFWIYVDMDFSDWSHMSHA